VSGSSAELEALRQRVELLEKGFLGISGSLERVVSILEILQGFKTTVEVFMKAVVMKVNP
jgi:hypothetical protein